MSIQLKRLGCTHQIAHQALPRRNEAREPLFNWAQPFERATAAALSRSSLGAIDHPLS